jgi:very-short-patch-repair endonuclease
MQGLRRDIYRIAQAQRGLVTRADLASVAATRNQRARLLAEGTLTGIGRRSYLVGGASPDPLRDALLASLDNGGPVSHRSAVALHRIPGISGPPLPDVLVLRRGKPDGSAVATVHTTTWLPADDITTVDGISCTSVARSLFNLAGLIPEVSAEIVRGAVDDAIRLGKASDAWLWWRLEKLRCRGRNGVSNLEAILVQRGGGEVTESWLEREFLRVLREAGLPIPRCQRRIRAAGAFVARVDFLYDELGIVIEVTGAKGHSSREQRAQDATRRNRLGMQGLLVLEFTFEQVVGDRSAVAEEVWRAIAGRRPLRHLAGA